MTSLVFHLLYPLTVTGTVVYPGNTLLSSAVLHLSYAIIYAIIYRMLHLVQPGPAVARPEGGKTQV